MIFLTIITKIERRRNVVNTFVSEAKLRSRAYYSYENLPDSDDIFYFIYVRSYNYKLIMYYIITINYN